MTRALEVHLRLLAILPVRTHTRQYHDVSQGSKYHVTSDMLELAVQMHAAGISRNDIAGRTGLSRRTLYNLIGPARG